MGRAGLLPQVSASYYGSKNYSDVTYLKYYQGKDVTVPRDYNSRNASVSLRQAVFNLEAIAKYRQGIAQSDYSDAVFSGKSEDLIMRLVGAYADAQYTEDQLRLSTAQRDAYVEQMKVNKRLLDLGEGTKTDMLETQAKAELAEAQVIEARDNLANARNALAGIVGMESNNSTRCRPISGRCRCSRPESKTGQHWRWKRMPNWWRSGMRSRWRAWKSTSSVPAMRPGWIWLPATPTTNPTR